MGSLFVTSLSPESWTFQLTLWCENIGKAISILLLRANRHASPQIHQRKWQSENKESLPRILGRQDHVLITNSFCWRAVRSWNCISSLPFLLVRKSNEGSWHLGLGPLPWSWAPAGREAGPPCLPSRHVETQCPHASLKNPNLRRPGFYVQIKRAQFLKNDCPLGCPLIVLSSDNITMLSF